MQSYLHLECWSELDFIRTHNNPSDLTPISNYTEQDNTVVDEEGFNWSDYDNYIENKLKEDIIDD